MLNSKKTIALAAALCAGSLGLAACSDNGDSTDTSTTTSAVESTTAVEADNSAAAIQLVDGYCRAKAAVEDTDAHEHMTEKDMKHADMTACFGQFKNMSDKDINVVSFSSPTLEGASTELHETVDGMMREKEGGFTIPAGGTYDLVPGGDHLMIMNYPDAIPAGDSLTVELKLDDGSTITTEIPVREQPSGEENYAGDMDNMEHMDHGDHAGH
ncbi:copper chaperone PCu(A)C [Corynebacterium sp. MSK044]|uniref:copper chaperone PCu(A)C n=1 Tax=Corynebacterium sp. MSK044 TaxID=3050195 RepID=UPI00254AB774|nr:copper chaperone PCu(A)C [Corynebacterium sp. MSK044]MDK8797920.1 copper chaperone PCu(A)C [Corynebacterium sp. MSK044]